MNSGKLPCNCISYPYHFLSPDDILEDGDTKDIAFLVVGDPLGYVAYCVIVV